MIEEFSLRLGNIVDDFFSIRLKRVTDVGEIEKRVTDVGEIKKKELRTSAK